MNLTLPEILYSSSNVAESKKISQLQKKGMIRKILPKAYTSNFEESDETIIKKHLFPLIARHYPEALVSHRTGFEFSLSPLSNIYLTSKQNRLIKWPGVTLKFAKGPAKLENDRPLFEGLCVSSLERSFLENLSSSRISGGESRTVSEEVIEEKLLIQLQSGGEKRLNELRDKAKEVSKVLGMHKEFEKLNQKIGAILSTKPIDILRSPIAMAQAFGEPYDPNRVNLFHKLAASLRINAFEQRPDKASTADEFRNFAFFECYFSNYIEGTTFEVEEAIEIIYQNKVIPNRNGDSHDIMGTFEICSNKFEMSKIASDPAEFVELLKSRHATIMQGRPDKEPGLFKEKPNRAGSTFFVLPNMVSGTLKAGFEALATIPTPLGRAIYMMFLISEVHPFNDGNGRIARVMMNAELVHAGEQRILIPTVYRDDYIGALRQLTRRSLPDAFMRMLNRIHGYSHWLNPSKFDNLLQQIKSSNALEEPDQGKLDWG